MFKIIDMKDDIVKVLFYLNLVLLVVGIFLTSKAYFITTIVINIIFTGAFIVIAKWSYVFDSQNKLFSGLNNKLNYFYSMGRRNG